MEPMIVWTNSSLVEQGATRDFSLDLEANLNAQQDDSNDFVLSLPISVRLQANSAVYVDGSRWGGLVQKRASDTEVDGLLEWRGRTWLGVLADRLLEPPSGQAYNYANGTVAECIDALISGLGLGDLFESGDCPSESLSNYQYPRYPNGMDALYGMLGSVGLRPTFSVVKDGGTISVAIGADETETASNAADGDKVEVAMLKVLTAYNHIIALGQGELTDRDVIHRYADSSGNVSSTKTITGLAERVYKYDYPNAESEELASQAEKKLAELQEGDKVSVSLEEGASLHLGDYVHAYDPRIDESVTARVTKCVVKVSNGVETCAWSAGE